MVIEGGAGEAVRWLSELCLVYLFLQIFPSILDASPIEPQWTFNSTESSECCSITIHSFTVWCSHVVHVVIFTEMPQSVVSYTIVYFRSI